MTKADLISYLKDKAAEARVSVSRAKLMPEGDVRRQALIDARTQASRDEEAFCNAAVAMLEADNG